MYHHLVYQRRRLLQDLVGMSHRSGGSGAVTFLASSSTNTRGHPPMYYDQPCSLDTWVYPGAGQRLLQQTFSIRSATCQLADSFPAPTPHKSGALPVYTSSLLRQPR
mmetsp:Transcript_31235/g.88579  ORF Transcript_31235/g.88579 Transcript_31235/m.88579 type:complete len:107 (-) Transcript_31235:126-446(-)